MIRWLHTHLLGHHYRLIRRETVGGYPLFSCGCGETWIAAPAKRRPRPATGLWRTVPTRRDTFARYV